MRTSRTRRNLIRKYASAVNKQRGRALTRAGYSPFSWGVHVRYNVGRSGRVARRGIKRLARRTG